MRVMKEGDGVVEELFRLFVARPDDWQPEWREGVGRLDEPACMRHIADYIAGMTDRYALIEHARHFAATPELV
jgi:dGTPase